VLTDSQDFANNAPTPQGYSQAFVNLKASTQQGGYLGLYTLNAYDVAACQAKCENAKSVCTAFNIYIERDPSIAPGADCPNPRATFNYKCTLYGIPITGSSATNKGQYRSKFQVAVTASNGYNKITTPRSVEGFTGPVPFPAAINAPLLDGQDTLLASKFFPGPLDPLVCATACSENTAYDRMTADQTTGEYKPCNFFNAYIMSMNGVPQGLYCVLYTAPWGVEYADNTGQTRGGDVFSISQSYGYTLTTQDCGNVNGCDNIAHAR
jgi:hypothetical protein